MRTMWTVGVMDEYSRYFWSGDRQVSVTVQRRLRACTSLRRRQSDSVSYIRMRRSCWNAAAGARATVRAGSGVLSTQSKAGGQPCAGLKLLSLSSQHSMQRMTALQSFPSIRDDTRFLAAMWSAQHFCSAASTERRRANVIRKAGEGKCSCVLVGGQEAWLCSPMKTSPSPENCPM
jgi:hypothetical protein